MGVHGGLPRGNLAGVSMRVVLVEGALTDAHGPRGSPEAPPPCRRHGGPGRRRLTEPWDPARQGPHTDLLPFPAGIHPGCCLRTTGSHPFGSFSKQQLENHTETGTYGVFLLCFLPTPATGHLAPSLCPQGSPEVTPLSVPSRFWRNSKARRVPPQALSPRRGSALPLSRVTGASSQHPWSLRRAKSMVTKVGVSRLG